ncbi:MAG: OmpA family protein [Bryobacteraceae bacterium]|nr:OmpA family protein [Bryobacteraceae bacterium]
MSADAVQNGHAGPDRFAELKAILVEPERTQLQDLQRRFDDSSGRAEAVSQILPEAVRLGASRGNQLRKALQPTIEEALNLSVKRNPRALAEALFPIFGKALRKAIAAELQATLQTLDHMLESSFSARSLRWRLEAIRTGKSYTEIVLLRSALYRVEQVFLIHRQTGLLLQHAVAGGETVKDPEMVSGMLTAIQDFVRDSFSPGSEELDTVRTGDLTLVIAYSPHAILAGAVRGVVPRELNNVFQDGVESIHASHLKQLVDFDGETSRFDDCRPVLDRCLLGQGDRKEGAVRSGWMSRALLFGIPAVVIILIAGWLTVRELEQRRWNQYIRSIESQPGIVVAHERRTGGRFLIRGLRDPLTRDPDVLLASAGLSRDAVDSRWETYESLQPQFTNERKYLRLKQILERRQFRFRPGSAEIPPEMDPQLVEISGDLRALYDAATQTGRSVRVEVHGDTDPLGPEQRNLTLAQDRAKAVADGLSVKGVSDSQLVLRGRGEGRSPCTGESDRERAACRSVSLRVLEGSTP